MNLAEVLERYKTELVDAASEAPFIVFLCGPNLTTKRPSAKFRARIKKLLEQEGFEVILGEDEGLNDLRLKGIGINAQDNEIEFIRHSCNAVIIIADSVGAFCELGLFSWHFVHREGVFQKGRKGPRMDFILLLSSKYRHHASYLNEGPTAAVRGFGQVEFVNFSVYDGSSVVNRLKSRRGTTTIDRRGRPRKNRYEDDN